MSGNGDTSAYRTLPNAGEMGAHRAQIQSGWRGKGELFAKRSFPVYINALSIRGICML
jgi:hypothetical protein